MLTCKSGTEAAAARVSKVTVGKFKVYVSDYDYPDLSIEKTSLNPSGPK